MNADSQILNLIHESKWMLRMKLEIPETAKAILAKEKQFKYYKIHLEQCLQDYASVSTLKFLTKIRNFRVIFTSACNKNTWFSSLALDILFYFNIIASLLDLV